MSEEKQADNIAVTPLGFISFPYLAAPDTGRPNSSGKYTAQLFVSKEDFKKDGGPLVKAVLTAGRNKFGPNATLDSFKHTIYDVDSLPPEKRAKLPELVRSGYIQINVASTRPPIVKDAKQNLMSLDEVQKIAGGDVCRFVVAAYSYNQKSGGVALGFNACQYKEKGSVSFGSGKSGVDMLSDLEVKMEDEPTAPATSAAGSAVPSGLSALGF